MYINTHCNYSQPTLIKLDNENIGGHLTPLHLGCTVWPQCTRVTTNDQRRHDTAYLNKRLFY